MDWFNIYGLIFVVGIMIPNVIFMITQKDRFENKYQNKLVETLEQIGRFGCMAFMLISVPKLFRGFWFTEAKNLYFILGVTLLLLYWFGWIVFWKRNSLIKSLILSILPSLLFILCGILMLNIPLMIFSLIFAFGHILISCKNAIL